jgi:hypothetical protein
MLRKKLIYEEIFTCKSGDLPLKYLGVPIHKKGFLTLIGNLMKIKWKKAWVVIRENSWTWGLG